MIYSFEDYAIELDKRPIKHIYLSITREGSIRLRVPKRMTDEMIDDFLRSKRDWIRQKLSLRPPVEARRWLEGETIRLLGQTYRLRLTDERLSLPRIEGDMIIMTQDNPTPMQAKLEKLYRTELKQYLDTSVPGYAALTGLCPKEWRIKKMKTRWGSCNQTDKRLWFSLLLAEKDPRLIDYVIVHELCHLQEGGHDRAFYELLAYHMPDWAVRAEALKTS